MLALGHWETQGYGEYALRNNESNEIVGSFGIISYQGLGEVELSWCLSKHMRRRRVSQKVCRLLIKLAFEKMSIDYLVASISFRNDISQKFALSLGFEKIDRQLAHGTMLDKWVLTRDLYNNQTN